VPANEPSSNDAYIRDAPLLARLPDDDLKALAARGRVRRFNAGATLFHEGDPGDAIYVVVDGRIRMSRLSGGGTEATLALIGPGDCTGELSLFDGRPRSATATAMQATRTFVVSRDDFVDWIRERPGASLALLETLSLRLRRTNEIVTDLVFLDLPHRLAKHLLSLAASHADGPNARRPRLQVTQSELASMLGVSRESVNKQLNQFSRDGWITISRGAVIIDDAEALRTFA
jgi:CRP/FNR family transcriptional regulator